MPPTAIGASARDDETIPRTGLGISTASQTILQIEIREVEDQREWMAPEKGTSAFDAVLEHLWSKLISLQATMDFSDSASKE